MKVTLFQTNPGADKPANLAALARMVDETVAVEKPDLILFPEVFDWMGGSAGRAEATEPEKDGPSYALCRDLARRHRIWVHGGSFRMQVPGENRASNTSVVFNRDGAEVARYSKIHMFDIVLADGQRYAESETLRPGDAIVTYECEGVTIGCAICYDLRFPELFQALAKKGAKVIMLPSAFTLQTGMDHWEVLCRARAIETETFFLACGMTGPHSTGREQRWTYGNSLVVDPWGQVIARASNGVGSISARLDLERVEKVRAQIPVAAHKVVGVRIPA